MSHDDLHIMSSKIISSAKAFLAYMCMTLDGDTQKKRLIGNTIHSTDVLQ